MKFDNIWFETHAHLCDPKFDADRDEAIDRAFQKGVSHLVEIADGPSEWDKARALAERYHGKIWWAAGLHPYFADQASDDLFFRLKDLTRHPQFVAIGEVGLDYAKCPIPPEQQKKALASALRLARETNKPLIIHCRDAYPDLLTVFRVAFEKNPTVSPGVIHCFSGNLEQANELIQMGFYLGVDAPITYPSAKALRDTLAAVSPSKLVLETDSPYLPPQPYRGQRNESAYLPLIGAELAKITGVPAAELATILRQNSNTLFRMV